MLFDDILKEPQVFSKMSKLGIPETLNTEPEDFTFENGWVSGEGFLFDPLPGVHFGACGPLHINTPIDSGFLYDTRLFFIMLVLEGSCTITLDQDSSHPLEDSMFLIGKWENQSGKAVIPAGQRYCHVAFMLEDTALEAAVGKSGAQEIEAALKHAAGRKGGGGQSLSGIARADTLIAARHVLEMQRADGLDILNLRGACLGLFTKLVCNIATTNIAHYPMPADDRSTLAQLKKRIEKDFLTLGPATDVCSEFNMSFSKANNGFKHLYSTTIAKYIQQCKMKHAYSLLLSRKMNVSECAFEIGYSNISHFILAFKKHYGLTPKKVACLQDGSLQTTDEPRTTTP